jgi:5-formyltetrahydrofolate cyclo-ligase
VNKTELRRKLKNHQIDEIQKLLEQAYLLTSLANIVETTKPTCLGLYSAIEHEVDLSFIFSKCQELQIATAYPRITGDVITFHNVDSLDMLDSKVFGIWEPSQTAPLVKPDLVVVPGIAFTKSGKRLGRGKGHYDRYLSLHSTHTISLVFSWALLDDLPTEHHDVLIDTVINYEPSLTPSLKIPKL